jgi:quaternary ammonium compound-resistance protein SugE
MAWIILVAAGIFEIAWAYLLKRSDGLTLIWPAAGALVTMLASVALLALAMRYLPLGTAYAVWTGIGTVGAFIAGVAALGEPATATRIAAVLLITTGLVLLKLDPSS